MTSPPTDPPSCPPIRPPARPLTRAQQLENAAFLQVLERTGNVRLAAREAGVKYGTIQHRRGRHPAFAQGWDAALAVAAARIVTSERPAAAKNATDPHRTQGGETVVVRNRDGRLQVRRAHPGKLTKRCEQAFLSALSASANVTLSAAAAGASPAAFARRRRNDPGFAREWRMALKRGYERIQAALLAAELAGSHADDAWRHNDPPGMPRMTVNQALQLLFLHQKMMIDQDEPPHIKRRRGESREAHSCRLAAMYEAGRERQREAFRVMEAARRERGEGPYWGPAPVLPDLTQVTGWSRADPAKTPHDATRALFGGWRIEDMEEKG